MVGNNIETFDKVFYSFTKTTGKKFSIVLVYALVYH